MPRNPLNALVEDQVMRLRRLLFWVNLQFHEPGSSLRAAQQITFGRYTGDTPLNSTDFKRKEAEESLSGLGERVYRDDMQSRPPDILITNFTMLEYMLLREDDRQLFTNPHLFSFIVLDELHTYSGTQGMEVSMLLRRLKGFLETKANKGFVAQYIGTSATLGGNDAKNEAAKFATTLFGSKFESTNVVLGTTPSRITAQWDPSRWVTFLNLLAELDLDQLFSQSANSQVDSHSWTSIVDGLNVGDLAFPPDLPFTEKLGVLFSHSGIADQVRTAIEKQSSACLEIEALADTIQTHVDDPRTVAGKLLGLLASATLKGEPLLALRTHFFVNEARSGQLCLSLSCKSVPTGTDAWWKRLYISHHSSCDFCNSRVFPLLLCRRCGFVYLQGWRYQSLLFPERDEGEKPENYERWLFRPVDSDLPELAKEIGHAYTVCLTCGRYFTARNDKNFALTQENHACLSENLLDIWVWRPQDLDNGQLESCLFCEQHWIPGEEVVTAPAPSTYAVSTLLLEEVKRQLDSTGTVSKIISFSDTRQQAAQLALRLQGTNRDFVFRQMVFHAITEKRINTDDLLEELFDLAKHEPKVRLVMGRDGNTADNVTLREQLATLLYREAVTAYLTLEAQALVRIEYDRTLLEAARQICNPSRILNRLSDDEKEQWFNFLLDWGLRFVRYSLGSHRWGGPDVNNEVLQQWNIYPKSAALSGARDPGTISFMITKRNRRNTLFNFAARLVRKGFRDAGELEIEEFQAAIKPFWSTILACSRLWARDAGMSSRPLLNNGGPDEDRCLIQLNFSSLLWKRAPVDQPIFRCDHCGRLAFYSIKAICPIRDCQGTLKSILPEEIDASRFSPVRHYRKLIAATSMTPLHVEEHTAQISAVKRDAVEREFRSTQPDSVDVICGSTTFELGIDLGSIQSVFMSNLPPRAANYRQRAGRAGRRVGAQPFILNYVRQRPHDQYFWNSLQAFIGGPLPVPRLAISSLEVVRRHAYAILIAHLLELYREGHPGRMGLTGPPAGSFVEFTLASITNTQICRELEATHPLAVRLDRFLKKV